MSGAQVGLVLRFRIDEGRSHEFRQHADLVLRAEKPLGCLKRGLFVKVGEPGVFLWVEQWESAALLAPHLVSKGHRALLGGIRLLGKLESERVVPLEAQPRATRLQ